MEKNNANTRKDAQLYKDKNEQRVTRKAPEGKAGIAATEEERATRQTEKKEKNVEQKNEEATD